MLLIQYILHIYISLSIAIVLQWAFANYCNCVFANRILSCLLSIPEIRKFCLQPLLKIHFKTFTKNHLSQWFIDIEYVNLATKNSKSTSKNDTRNADFGHQEQTEYHFSIQYICQTKDFKYWYICFSNKHVALGRKIYHIWGPFDWGRFDLLPFHVSGLSRS